MREREDADGDVLGCEAVMHCLYLPTHLLLFMATNKAKRAVAHPGSSWHCCMTPAHSLAAHDADTTDAPVVAPLTLGHSAELE